MALDSCAIGVLHCACPLVPNFRSALVLHLASQMCMIGTDLQRHTDGGRSLPAHDHPESVRMPHAKFHADPLTTVAMHKEQRNRLTHRFGFMYIRFALYLMKLFLTCLFCA